MRGLVAHGEGGLMRAWSLLLVCGPRLHRWSGRAAAGMNHASGTVMPLDSVPARSPVDPRRSWDLPGRGGCRRDAGPRRFAVGLPVSPRLVPCPVGPRQA